LRGAQHPKAWRSGLQVPAERACKRTLIGVRVYVNGVLVNYETKGPLPFFQTPSGIVLGPHWGGYSWSGAIDELRLSGVKRYGPKLPKGVAWVAIPVPAEAAPKAAPATVRKPPADAPAQRAKLLATIAGQESFCQPSRPLELAAPSGSPLADKLGKLGVRVRPVKAGAALSAGAVRMIDGQFLPSLAPKLGGIRQAISDGAVVVLHQISPAQQALVCWSNDFRVAGFRSEPIAVCRVIMSLKAKTPSDRFGSWRPCTGQASFPPRRCSRIHESLQSFDSV